MYNNINHININDIIWTLCSKLYHIQIFTYHLYSICVYSRVDLRYSQNEVGSVQMLQQFIRNMTIGLGGMA